MAQKQVYIHIGPSKTGSTTLQKALAEQSESDSPLIYYPKAGRLNDGKPTQRSNQGKIYTELYHVINHTNIYYALLGTMVEPSSDDILNMLAAEVAECSQNRVVISSEGFFGLSEHIQKLIDLLGDCDIKVLLYIRNPEHRTISSYREKVRTENMTRSFEDFIGGEAYFIHEPTIIERWAGYVGGDKIITRPFEQVAANPGLYQDFCNVVGIDDENLDNTESYERANTSLNDQNLMAIRYLSKIQKKLKTGGLPFLVCINLKRILSQSAFVRIILGCMLFPFRNSLISTDGVALLRKKLEKEINDMAPKYQLMYQNYIKHP